MRIEILYEYIFLGNTRDAITELERRVNEWLSHYEHNFKIHNVLYSCSDDQCSVCIVYE